MAAEMLCIGVASGKITQSQVKPKQPLTCLHAFLRANRLLPFLITLILVFLLLWLATGHFLVSVRLGPCFVESHSGTILSNGLSYANSYQPMKETLPSALKPHSTIRNNIDPISCKLTPKWPIKSDRFGFKAWLTHQTLSWTRMFPWVAA